MATFLLDYDILDVTSRTCGEWVQLSGADLRRRAEGYGFRFNGDTPPADFICLDCNCPTQDSYHVIIAHHMEGDRELRDVTAQIHNALGRSSG
ncbi:MAG: hypothetical protein GDA40_08515 [Rhodobacteraceae bacterium]|nr:hypothetical protein [Paracoccaceae bacterium]